MRARHSTYAVLAALTMHRLSAYNSGGDDAAAAAAAAANIEAASSAASVASGTDDAAAVAAAAAASAAAAAAPTDAATAGAVPDTYDLKLPDGSTLPADFVTRTADTARALGLSNEAGQKLLDAQIAEIAQATTATKEAVKAETIAAMQPGGAVWNEQEALWRNQSLTDVEIGGSPEKLTANVELANKVVNRFATEGTKDFFQKSGLGSHPELIRVFARIGRQMSESTLVLPHTTSGGTVTEEERLAKRYPTMVAKS